MFLSCVCWTPAHAQTTVHADHGVAAGRDVNIGGDVTVRVVTIDPKLMERLVVEPMRKTIEALTANCEPGKYRSKDSEPCCPKGEAAVDGSHCCRSGEEFRNDACVPQNDETSCKSGDQAACIRLGRSSIEALAPDRALDYLEPACTAGNAEACGLSSRILLDSLSDRDQRACSRAVAACGQGDRLGCGVLGFAQFEKYCSASYVRPADVMLGEACEETADPRFCAALVLMWGDGRVTAFPKARADAIANTMCTGASGSADGCLTLGVALKQRAVRGHRSADEVDSARAFEHACERGATAACGLAGVAYSLGEGVAKNTELAFQLFNRACDQQDGPSCDAIGSMYQHGVLVQEDANRARKSYELACSLGTASGCTHVRELQTRGVPVLRTVSYCVIGAGVAAATILGVVALKNSTDDATPSDARLARATAAGTDVAIGISALAAVVLVLDLALGGPATEKSGESGLVVSSGQVGAIGTF